MFSEELLLFSWVMERVEGTLYVEVFVWTFAFVKMFEEGFSWDIVVRIIGTFEHLLAFDNFFSLHDGFLVLRKFILKSPKSLAFI